MAGSGSGGQISDKEGLAEENVESLKRGGSIISFNFLVRIWWLIYWSLMKETVIVSEIE